MTTFEQPKLKNGNPITPDIFNDIFYTIEEETNKLDEKCQKEIYNLKYEIMDIQDKEIKNLKYEIMILQDNELKEYRTNRALWAIVCVMGIFILILLLCIILGVF